MRLRADWNPILHLDFNHFYYHTRNDSNHSIDVTLDMGPLVSREGKQCIEH